MLSTTVAWWLHHLSFQVHRSVHRSVHWFIGSSVGSRCSKYVQKIQVGRHKTGGFSGIFRASKKLACYFTQLKLALHRHQQKHWAPGRQRQALRGAACRDALPHGVVGCLMEWWTASWSGALPHGVVDCLMEWCTASWSGAVHCLMEWWTASWSGALPHGVVD